MVRAAPTMSSQLTAVTRRPYTKSAMTQVSIFNLILLVLTIGAQHLARPRATGITRASPFLPILGWLTFIASATLIGLLTYQTALTYFSWLSSPLSRLLLPPYQGVHYFIFYSFTEFWANHLLAALVGLVSYLVIKRYARHEESFFYPEEPILCFLSLLLVGHPLWLIYVLTLLIAALIGSLWTHCITKTNNRVSLRYLWLPLAGLIITLSPILKTFDFFIYLNF